MHLRTSLLSLIIAAALTPVCEAQKWASEMFNKIDHDFKTVARGSDTVYRFEITNKYKENIRLVSVRSSCGCTSPSLENKELKTWEKGYVVAKFNTRTFTGIHSATLTVLIEVNGKKVEKRIVNGAEQPYERNIKYTGQVQLRVHGNIRGDIVFEPGAIVFGEVDQGQTVEKRVAVTFSGRSGWRIQDVRSASDNLEVELTERHRQGGRVVYDLLSRLKSTSAPGLLQEQLVLVTNDSTNVRVPIDVEGRVIPEISVAPTHLVFGKVQEGKQATKRLMVRGKTPFRVTSVECEDGCFSFNTDEEAKQRHIIEVAFTGKGKPGEMKAPIIIKTDRGDTFVGNCTAYVTLEKAPEEEVAETEGAGTSVASGEELAKDR